MNIQHYARINPFNDTLQGSNFILVSSALKDGRTIRIYELKDQTDAALIKAVDTIRVLIERNPCLSLTFLLQNARSILREKPCLTINGEAVCLSEEKEANDVPLHYVDRYFSQDILRVPIRCSRGHLLEGSSALLWFQNKRHCPGEGPPHTVEELKAQQIVARVVTDFWKARNAKRQGLNIFEEELKSPYEIDLFAKLIYPQAKLLVVEKTPLRVRITIDNKDVIISSRVKRAAFETALRTKTLDQTNYTLQGSSLTDEPPFEIVNQAFSLDIPLEAPALPIAGIQLNPIKWILDSALKRVDKSIQKAIDEGNHALLGLIMTAGAEVKKAIDHFSHTYKDHLDYTVDKVSDKMQNALNQLVSIVDHFEQLTEQGLSDATQKAQQLINSLLPFTPNNQLTSSSPNCFVVTDFSQKSNITFKGNFPWVGKKDDPWGYLVFGYLFSGRSYDPKLRLNETECELFKTNTQVVEFRFPHSIFKELPDKSKFMMASGKITFPYNDVGWLWSTAMETSYHVTLLALPRIAGKVNATFQKGVKVEKVIRQEKQFKSNGVGNQDNGPFWKNYSPDEGYLFDLKTLKVNVNGNGHYIDKTNYQPTNLSITLCFNKQGWFALTITCDQIKSVTEDKVQDRKEETDLIWGELIQIKPQIDEKLDQFIFHDCRGKKDVFSPPCISKGILKIAAKANGVFELTAIIPKDVGDFLNGN